MRNRSVIMIEQDTAKPKTAGFEILYHHLTTVTIFEDAGEQHETRALLSCYKTGTTYSGHTETIP